MSDLGSLTRKAWVAALVLLMILAGPAGALAQGPSVEGIETTTFVTTLRVETPSYQLDALGLRVPGYGTNSIPGAPALPVWSTIVELPPTGEPIVTVEAGATRVLGQRRTLPAVPVLLPADLNPLGWSADVDRPAVATAADRPDPAIYKANAFYPAAIAQAGAVQWQGGRRLLPLRVFPFQYNAVAGTLRYYADLRVTVRVKE